MNENLSFEWEKVLVNSVKDGKIRELYLTKIPILKNCTDWKLVQPVGRIDYKMSLSHYKGIVAKYKQKIYFIPENVVNALYEFVKWKVPPLLEVIPEKKRKKSSAAKIEENNGLVQKN